MTTQDQTSRFGVPNSMNFETNNNTSHAKAYVQLNSEKSTPGEIVNGCPESAVSDEKCHLLAPPPEMRNRIYRYVLVDWTQTLFYDESTCYQPALVRTCKQIRKEALGIFYAENQFALVLVDLAVWPQLEHWLWKELKAPMRRIVCIGRAEWSAMMPWLRLIHERKVDLTTRVAWDFLNNELWGSFMNNAISIAWALRHTPWTTAVKTLEIFKRAAQRMSEADAVDPELWA